MRSKSPTPESIEAMIDAYWQAIDSWKKAARRKADLAKKLDPEIMRAPRVVVARNVTDAANPRPIYAHNEYEIRNCLQSHKDANMAIHGIDAARRRKIAAQYRERVRRLARELKQDREALQAEQRAVGWRQAVEAEERTSMAVYTLIAKISGAKPTNKADTRRLVEWLRDAIYFETRASAATAHQDLERRGSYPPGYSVPPYGVGEHQMIKLLGRVLDATQPGPLRKAA